MESQNTNKKLYVPNIITQKEEAGKWVYDWYNWPNWSNWGRRAEERKIPYIAATEYSI
jgi:hypothetical protein